MQIAVEKSSAVRCVYILREIGKDGSCRVIFFESEDGNLVEQEQEYANGKWRIARQPFVYGGDVRETLINAALHDSNKATATQEEGGMIVLDAEEKDQR